MYTVATIKPVPPNSLHRLLPEDWGQGKRQRAINRYKKDLRQAEEELQQLHFHEQPGGLPDSPAKATADPSARDDCVWEYYADIINKGDFHSEAPKCGGYIRKYVAAGDEHSSHSDEELIASLPNTYFKPVQCPEEEEDTTTSARPLAAEERVLRRRPSPFAMGASLRFTGNSTRTPSLHRTVSG